jgi:hypothetical protein
MSRKEGGRVEKVVPGKYVQIKTENGDEIKLPITNTVIEERIKRKSEKERISKALQTLMPIKRILANTHEGGVDQDAYFVQLEQGSSYEHEDYRDRYRHACAVLMGCGIEAQEAAEALLSTDKDLDMDEIVVMFKVSELRNEIVSYYPRNFSKDSTYPRK